jgi:hypothetical protein
MAGQSVHFWGKANVLAAYRSLEIPAWSLWQGSQMLPFKYEGDEVDEGAEKLLATFNAMTESTNALYTLKVYETLPKDKKISKSTPDHGAFNFRLNLEMQGLNQQQLQSVTSRTQLESELAAMKLELAELREQLDEEPETNDPDMWEKINGLLEKPAVVGAINRIFKLDIQPRAATIGNVPVVGEEKLIEAIEILKQHDPRITEHMWKLALMAQQKPNNFQFLLSTLDTLQ